MTGFKSKAEQTSKQAPAMQVIADDRYQACPLAWTTQTYKAGTTESALILASMFKQEGYGAWVAGSTVHVLLSTMGE